MSNSGPKLSWCTLTSMIPNTQTGSTQRRLESKKDNYFSTAHYDPDNAWKLLKTSCRKHQLPYSHLNSVSTPRSALQRSTFENPPNMDPHAHSSRSSTPSTPLTPTSPSSSTGSYFSESSRPSSPPVPLHIIVTFNGKVREMLRIERESDAAEEEQRRQRRAAARVTRPRYYARSLSEEDARLEVD